MTRALLLSADKRAPIYHSHYNWQMNCGYSGLSVLDYYRRIHPDWAVAIQIPNNFT